MQSAPAYRESKLSVTVFIKHHDQFLFLLRSLNRNVDAGRLNGVGGKLEPAENYLSAAVRETHEETGYAVTATDFTFEGIIKIEGGYPQDWLVAFFSVEVDSPEVPCGMKIAEGELMWLSSEEVLSGKFELVDDLYHLFPLVVERKHTFFATALVNDQEKIDEISITTLPK